MSELFRKIWHASSGVMLAFMIYYISPMFFQSFAVAFTIFFMIIRVMKSKNYAIPIIDNYLGAFGRGKELGDTALYFLLGAFIASLFFERKVAAVSILVLAVSDALATLVGIQKGTHKLYKKKTIEGSTAFFISSFLIISFFYGPLIAFIVGLASTLVELFGWFDDNIVIPPMCSLMIQLLKTVL